MIAVRAGPETQHVVDAGILKRLGEDGYVVNISRGSVIDEKALVAALSDKVIAGAGLDVYDEGPHAPGRADRPSQRGAGAAYRRTHPRIACCHAELRAGEPDRVFRGQVAAV